MTIARVRVRVKWFQFHQRILYWQNRHRSVQNARVDHARERSISILRTRYGFTREQAIYQLRKYYSKALLDGSRHIYYRKD